MAQKTIVTLKGRKLELILESNQRVAVAHNAAQEALNDRAEAVTAFHAMMEVVTGDNDPGSLLVDPETGKVTREVPDIPKTPTRPRGAAKGRKPAKKKTGPKAVN